MWQSNEQHCELERSEREREGGGEGEGKGERHDERDKRNEETGERRGNIQLYTGKKKSKTKVYPD